MNRNISEQELAICRMFGNNPEEYLNTMEQDNVTAMNREALIKNGVMTEQELAICRMFGNDPEEYLATKKASGVTVLNRSSDNGNIATSPPYSIAMPFLKRTSNITSKY